MIRIGVSSEFVAAADPQEYIHDPIELTTEGIVVFGVHGTTASDLIPALTYGGITLDRQGSEIDTVTEPGRIYAWFKGEGLPNGPQTVSADRTEALEQIHLVTVTLHGNGKLLVADVKGISENVNYPTEVNLQWGERLGLAVGGLYAGGFGPEGYDHGPKGAMLQLPNHDFGAFSSEFYKQKTAVKNGFRFQVMGDEAGGPLNDDTALIVLGIVQEFEDPSPANTFLYPLEPIPTDILLSDPTTLRGGQLKELQGIVLGISTLSGELSGVFVLDGTALGTGSTAGDFVRLMELQGLVFGIGTPQGSLAARIAIVGVINGLGTSVGDLIKLISLAGAASGVGTPAGLLNNIAVITGAASGAGFTSGALAQIIALTGIASGIGTPSGNLIHLMELIGAANGIGTPTGNLAARIALQGLVSGLGTPVGALAQRIALQGLVTGQATVIGDIVVQGAVNQIDIIGAILGQGTAVGLLSGIIVLQGAAGGISSAEAEIVKRIQLSGETSGIAQVDANLDAVIALQGQVIGYALVVGDLGIILGIPIVSCPTGVYLDASQTIVLIAASQNIIGINESGVAPLFGGETGVDIICLTEEEEVVLNG